MKRQLRHDVGLIQVCTMDNCENIPWLCQCHLTGLVDGVAYPNEGPELVDGVAHPNGKPEQIDGVDKSLELSLVDPTKSPELVDKKADPKN